MPTQVFDESNTPTGYLQLTVTTTAQSLTPPTDNRGERPIEVELNIEGGSIRYTDDGSVPTTTRGMLYAPGTSKIVSLKDLSTIQVCAVTGTVILNCSYYWEG